MARKNLKHYAGKDFTIHGDIIAICQGDYISAIALEVIIHKTADFMTRHNLRSDAIPWIDLGLRDIEHCCLGLASHSSFGERLKQGGLLYQLGFIESRFIGEDPSLPVIRQFLLKLETVKSALETVKSNDKPRWQ